VADVGDEIHPKRAGVKESVYSGGKSGRSRLTAHGCGGTSPPDEPADRTRPSARGTRRAFALLDPSFAAAPRMVTSSPTCTDVGRHPPSSRALGGASSTHQCAAVAAPSVTSM